MKLSKSFQVWNLFFLFFVSFLQMSAGAEETPKECLDIVLKSGEVIHGVHAKYEKAFGKKYVVYWYSDPNHLRRIDALLIHHFEDAECLPEEPETKKYTIIEKNNKSQTDDELWKRIYEIIHEPDLETGERRWRAEIQGRYVNICGTLAVVHIEKEFCVMEMRIQNGDLQQTLIGVFPGNQGVLLKRVNFGDTLCVSGRIDMDIGVKQIERIDTVFNIYQYSFASIKHYIILSNCKVNDILKKKDEDEKKEDTSSFPRVKI